MLSSAVADRTIVRLRAPSVANRYGDAEADWSAATATTIAGCALQPAGSTEFTDPTRTVVTTRWTLFLPPGTDLAPGDRVDVDGVTYEVDGEPLDWSAPGGNLDHVAAVLQRVEG
jgi:hypothetical protein